MSQPLAINAQDVRVHFPGAQRDKPVRAVDGVSLKVERGAFHAIVGESGCGKTTLARALVGLQPVTSGSVTILDKSLSDWKKDRKALARQLQFVFQNPLGALSRRQSVYQSLEEPLIIHGFSSLERDKRVTKLMDLVGLPASSRDRLPRSLSGGQRQRVAIARALMLDAEILICDEPLSALDVSIQAQIVQLFVELQRELELTVVMISHDLAVVREMCSDVTVMYLGRTMEAGSTETIFDAPRHPYTQALLSSVPSPDPVVESTRSRILLEGDPPSPMAPPPGCSFHTRCRDVQAKCREAVPELIENEDGQSVACHFPHEINNA
jgi:oligopeptide/dipeptide ABC transporter ATP-binding protein